MRYIINLDRTIAVLTIQYYLDVAFIYVAIHSNCVYLL